MLVEHYQNMQEALDHTRAALLNYGQLVKTKNWQSEETKLGMWEINNYVFATEVPEGKEGLNKILKPDQPWAEMHFQERVCGHPINPAPSYLAWPYYQGDEVWRKHGEKFAHTYPERMWVHRMPGVRFEYGNLDNVVKLLDRDPMTRQAFLPIWFPEDTGSMGNYRVPCTIGYHFIIRDDELNMVYYIRSCDYRRHFKNDVYLACRLLQWVLNELWKLDSLNHGRITIGTLTMYITNLHVFEGEQELI